MTDSAFEGYLTHWRESDPGRSTAWLFLRPDERIFWGALAALQEEWLDILRAVNEPQVVAAKLGWWREEMRCAASGEARHPLTQMLFADARAGGIPKAGWVAAVDACMFAQTAAPPADFSTQCDTVRPLARAFAELETGAWFGAVAHGTRAESVILCEYLIANVRRLAAGAGGGRSLLPMNLLARHALTLDDLAGDGPHRRAALRDYAADLRRTLKGAVTMDGPLTLFRMLRAQHDLRALELCANADDPLQALQTHAHGFSNLLKTWRTARTWRKISSIGKFA